MNCFKRNTLYTTMLLSTVTIASSPAFSGEEEELLTFIQLMETSIAVKTEKLDQDKSPGLVTVLRGDDLEARGIRTVNEALSLVAGFDVPVDSLGISNPVVRGVGGILASASGKIKYLLNGSAVNVSLSANGGLLLAMPVMQIERIEFIRGPGAAVYGEYAYSGVINIVTRDDSKRVGFGYGSFDTLTGVGSYSHTSESGWHSSGSIAGWVSDGADEKVGPDVLGVTGKPNKYGNHKNALLSLAKDEFKVSFQYLENGSGDYFGLSNALPPQDNREVFGAKAYLLDINHAWDLSDDVILKARAGYKHFESTFDKAYVNPPGFNLVIPPFPPFFPGLDITYPDGMIASTNYEENRWEVGGELIWDGMDNHTVLLGMEYSDTKDDNIYAINNFSPTFPPLPLPEFTRFPGEIATLPEGYNRKIASVYMQDQFHITEGLDLTAGFRYDDYNDVGSAITPRVALVYQPSSQHIFKAQYAEAFRPPTFVELSSVVVSRLGNPDIDPETSTNYELAYIFKSRDTVVRTTAFYTDMDDLITIPRLQYDNSRGAKIKGLEMELEHRFSQQFKFDGNISFTDTEDKETGGDMLGAADTLANASLLYQPDIDSSYVLRYRYVSARHRSVTDIRKDLGSENVVDAVGSWFNVASPGLTVRAGVKNLFDEDTFNPAAERTYANDYPRAGRSYWAQLTKDF